jgi:hypothetical protein
MAFKFVHLKGPQKGLKRLCKTWHEILKWYEDQEKDLPYWYSERTNIGHLALAVYQLGGVPIQEFSCRKGKGKENSTGRADLYISMPNGNRSLSLNIEAKHAWCSVTLNGSAILKENLYEAVQDCKNLKEKAWKAHLGAGLVFLTPYAKTMPDHKTAISAQQRSFTNRVIQESKKAKANFIAFHYPTKDRLWKISLKYQSEAWSWCPGIAVIGKLIR